jgi:hypothetical protein
MEKSTEQIKKDIEEIKKEFLERERFITKIIAETFEEFKNNDKFIDVLNNNSSQIFTSMAHMGIGLYIRNKYLYAEGSPWRKYCEKDGPAFANGDLPSTWRFDADWESSQILEALYYYSKGRLNITE